MSLPLKNIVRYTNDSQKIISMELKIEKPKLELGLSLYSTDFQVDSLFRDQFPSWYFQLTLSRINQLCLWLRSRGNVYVNIGYTVMVFDDKEEFLHSRISPFCFKDFLYINLFQGFSKSISTLNFPLTVVCFLVILNTKNEVISVQNVSEDAVPVQNATGETVTSTNNDESTEIDCLQELSANFGKLFDNSIGTDITLQIDGMSMKAHKMVLRTRSPVFDKMFDYDTSEATENEIDKDIRAPIMKELLRFLYTGTKKDYDFNDASDLYYAADKYEVLSLRKNCKKDLLRHLQVDNACQLLILATNHGDESFKEEILEFIKSNFKKIVLGKSFEDLAKYDANLAVLLMRNHMISKSE